MNMKNKDHDLETTHRVSIVIINWNNWMDTLECLKSLLNINNSVFQIVLVDNNSTDDSGILPDKYPWKLLNLEKVN